MTDAQRDKKLTAPRIASDLVVFTLLMVGSLAGSIVLIDQIPPLGCLALIFSFGYMAWQFETFGRIREFRLIADRTRPLSSRAGNLQIVSHVLRIILTVYLFWVLLPSPVTIAVGALCGVGMIAYQTMVPSSLGALVDAHEQSRREQRLRKLMRVN